jgi:hypothetical protein
MNGDGHNCFSGDLNRDYVFMLSKRKPPSTRDAICLLIALVTFLKCYLTRSMWSPGTPVWSISSRDSPDFVAWNNQSFAFFPMHQQINPSKFLLTYINRDAVADSDHLNQLIGKRWLLKAKILFFPRYLPLCPCAIKKKEYPAKSHLLIAGYFTPKLRQWTWFAQE